MFCNRIRIVLLGVVFLLGATESRAQFQSVHIGVNGLTCSQCSRTVEMKLRKLDFVADVQMNLEHTDGTILLRKDKKTDIDKIAQAVIDAGFSVGELDATMDAGSISPVGSCFSYDGAEYVLLSQGTPVLKGNVQLKFAGKRFMTTSAYKKIAGKLVNSCGSSAGKVYYVTISS